MFETSSALSGRIQVVDQGDERRLVADGDTLSSIPLSGDWSRLRREYWWRALDGAVRTRQPAALFVGAGGGTQLHLIHARSAPRAVTVVERDPVILRVAQRYFGLDRLGRVEFLCAAIEDVLPWLLSSRRRFDFIMEDAMHRTPLDQALPVVARLAGLLGPRGALVLNRHARHDAVEIAAALRPAFARVALHRIRGRDNTLIFATGPRRSPPDAAIAPRPQPVTARRKRSTSSSSL